MARSVECQDGEGEAFAVPVESKVANVFVSPMRKGRYGQTRLDVFPFRVVLNGEIQAPRQQISLVHEMLHVWAELHKLPEFHTKYHDKLHDLAVFIYQEIVPVLVRFAKARGQSVPGLTKKEE